MAIFTNGRTDNSWKRVFKDLFSLNRVSERQMQSLVFHYLMDNPKTHDLQNKFMDGIYGYIPKLMTRSNGHIVPIDRCGHTLHTRNEEYIAVICDNGKGTLPPDVYEIFAKNIPFMLDLHLHDGAKINMHLREKYDDDTANLAEYIGARLVSMDVETLDMLGGDPLLLQSEYKWDDIVVNRGTHSVWFTAWDGGKIVDFKYHDGAENEATYESKREIIAGFAAEYALNDYKKIDAQGVHIVQRVLRDYWAAQFESEKTVSYNDALQILEPRNLVYRYIAQDMRPR